MSPSFASFIQWHAHTRRRGLELDLVILDERGGEPAEQLRTELQTGVASEMLGKPGGVFLLTADRSRPMTRCCSRPPRGLYLAVVAGRWPISLTIVPPRRPRCRRNRLHTRSQPRLPRRPARQPEGLRFWNGFGGFTGDGREYVIVIDGTPPVDRPCRRPPGPMCWPIRDSDAW